MDRKENKSINMVNKQEKDRSYYLKNKQIILDKNKIWREQNKEKLKLKAHNKYEENKISILKKNKEWYYKNLDFVREQQKIYRRTERIKNPKIRIMESIRVRTNKAFKSQKTNKNNHTIDLLGCTNEEYTQHIKTNFQKGMTLNNYGEWHIDHIIPLSSFNLTKEEEQLKAFHYTNTQPLWAKDNLSKGAKI